MVEKIKQYALYIIIGLFVLLCLQTCRSCSKSNNLEWSELESGTKIDSLINISNNANKKIDSLQYELNKKENECESLKLTIQRLEGDKTYLQDQNKTLNSNLKKSLDKNEEPK